MFRVAAVAIALVAVSCGVSESEVVANDGLATDSDELRKNNPCMTVRCAAGTHCVARGQRASCEPNAQTCQSDADCRLFDNYCDGCACDALSNENPDPFCGGTLVQCFAQPCAGKTAVCKSGRCQVGTASTGGVACGPNTCTNGQVCCNASCGICTDPDMFCTQQACL